MRCNEIEDGDVEGDAMRGNDINTEEDASHTTPHSRTCSVFPSPPRN